MPTYNYKCSKCDEKYELVLPMSKYKSGAPICCEKQTIKYLVPNPNGFIGVEQFKCYSCPVTDEIVTTQKQKDYIEAKNDLIVIEKGMQPKREKKFKDETPDALKPEMERQIEMMKTGAI